ncbi:MAG: nitroreductase family deazaflavin-dependent oxidoreductase [Chloroflexi bacterium]|nr:MAG: nitroreductase family deazaflavin-dependent oxidoreductase [Chloroflexota bacterium]TME54982.1 MAG: nitroreductase family deazaflavin-dependent oxidoreductase [Chloroflexota bacterium]
MEYTPGVGLLLLSQGVPKMNVRTEMSRPADIPGFVDRIVRPLTHLFNPLILRIAGGWWFPMFSLIHHRGHKSGRIYATPVTAFPRGGYFWLGLAFGENSGWARNVLAAGDAALRYRGTDYHLVEATVVELADVKDQVPPIVRIGSAVGGMRKTLRMRIATEK